LWWLLIQLLVHDGKRRLIVQWRTMLCLAVLGVIMLSLLLMEVLKLYLWCLNPMHLSAKFCNHSTEFLVCVCVCVWGGGIRLVALIYRHLAPPRPSIPYSQTPSTLHLPHDTKNINLLNTWITVYYLLWLHFRLITVQQNVGKQKRAVTPDVTQPDSEVTN
jgi:hypothetical protein